MKPVMSQLPGHGQDCSLLPVRISAMWWRSSCATSGQQVCGAFVGEPLVTDRLNAHWVARNCRALESTDLKVHCPMRVKVPTCRTQQTPLCLLFPHHTNHPRTNIS